MKNKLQFFLLGILVLCILFAYMGCNKDDRTVTGPSSGATTQIDANGTLTPTTRTQAQGTLIIADQNGNAITGITSQNISIQLTWGTSSSNSIVGTVAVQSLAQTGKSTAVAMTMDYSGSMYTGNYVNGKYQQIIDMENGVKAFVNAIKTNDVCEIIKFDDVVKVIQPFTSSKQALLHAVDSIPILGYGNTALYQSIYSGIQDVAGKSASSYARAVIAFTDGGENSSSISLSTLLQTARLNAVPVYTIGLFDASSHSTPPGQYYPEKTLVQIADSTGGFYYYAPGASQLQQIYNSISGQLSNGYIITITWPSTSLPTTGTVVTVVITVNYNGLTSVFNRTYTMP